MKELLLGKCSTTKTMPTAYASCLLIGPSFNYPFQIMKRRCRRSYFFVVHVDVTDPPLNKLRKFLFVVTIYLKFSLSITSEGHVLSILGCKQHI